MNSKRLYFTLLALIFLSFIGLVGGAYVANGLLTKKASTLTTLKAKSMALEQERLALTKAKNDIKKYADLVTIAKAVVPQDKNQAQAVGEIVKIADKNNIKLASITFPASTLGNKAAPAAGAIKPVAGATAIAKPPTDLSQLAPVKNIPGVFQLVIQVQSDPNEPIPYGRFISFLADLERNRRTAQVDTITLSPDPDNRNNLTFQLSLNEYIKP